MRTRHVLAATAALALVGSTAGAALTGASAASGDHKAKPTVDVVAKKLVGPLSVAQAPDGTRYWADSFAGLLYKQTPGRSAGRRSSTRASTTAPTASRPTAASCASSTGSERQQVRRGLDPERRRRGWSSSRDTFKYEKQANPDGKFKYGLLNTPKSCLKQAPKEIRPYSGTKETHSYAVATTANGVTYVADAGANAILALSPTGVFSTVAALKPVKVTLTKQAAEANDAAGLPVGKKFALEAVPTDVEVAADGSLYVTSLPGGPEDPSLGANGRVLRIDPATGKVSTVVEGLITPTGVAVASNGDLYVAQLFLGEISKVKAGKHKAKTYLKVAAARPRSRRPRPACSRPSTLCRWARSPRDRSSRSRPDPPLNLRGSPTPQRRGSSLVRPTLCAGPWSWSSNLRGTCTNRTRPLRRPPP